MHRLVPSQEEPRMYVAKPACLDNRVSGKLATEVDMQIRLIESLDSNGLGVLPGNHLQHHLMPAHVCQLPHCVHGFNSDLQNSFLLKTECKYGSDTNGRMAKPCACAVQL